MNPLIGTITGFILILIFLFFEKRPYRLFDRTHLLFLPYVLFCAFLVQASEHMVLWVGLSVLLYTVLDDMATKSLNIYLPLLTTLWFVLLIEKPYFFIYSFAAFLILLLLTKITKEQVMGEGDAYVFLPISVLLLSSLETSSFLLMADRWIEAFLISTLLAAIVMTPFKLFKSELDDFAFAPFLVMGFLIAFSGWTLGGWLLVVLFGISFLMLTFGAIVLIVRHVADKKKDT